MAEPDTLQQDAGVLCAPTAFGKAVVAAAIIAERRINTSVLVHRTDLLNQWRERLQSFLGVGIGEGVIGTIRHRNASGTNANGVIERWAIASQISLSWRSVERCFAVVQSLMQDDAYGSLCKVPDYAKGQSQGSLTADE